jgi:hypothetical protein
MKFKKDSVNFFNFQPFSYSLNIVIQYNSYITLVFQTTSRMQSQYCCSIGMQTAVIEKKEELYCIYDQYTNIRNGNNILISI